MDLKEGEGVEWIQIAQNKVWWQAFVYSRGLKLKSYAGQTDNFEIYGGPHIIFSKKC
jgi:hypothetical protein